MVQRNDLLLYTNCTRHIRSTAYNLTCTFIHYTFIIRLNIHMLGKQVITSDALSALYRSTYEVYDILLYLLGRNVPGCIVIKLVLLLLCSLRDTHVCSMSETNMSVSQWNRVGIKRVLSQCNLQNFFPVNTAICRILPMYFGTQLTVLHLT